MSGMQKQTTSSGSDSDPRYAHVDERKRKRMISNRESARRSRMKKQKLLEDLIGETTQLQNENAQLRQNISAKAQCFVEVESANNVLRAQIMELTQRLQSLNSVLQIAEELNGFDEEIPEVPLMEPWQVHYPVQSITAAADVFEY